MRPFFFLVVSIILLYGYDQKLREEFIENFSRLQKAIQEKQDTQEKNRAQEEERVKQLEEERKKRLEAHKDELNYIRNELEYLRAKEQFEREVGGNSVKQTQKDHFYELSSKSQMLLKINISGFSGRIEVGDKKKLILRGEDIDKITDGFVRYLKNRDQYQSALYGVPAIYKELELKFGQNSGYFLVGEGEELTHNLKLLEVRDNMATFLVKL